MKGPRLGFASGRTKCIPVIVQGVTSGRWQGRKLWDARVEKPKYLMERTFGHSVSNRWAKRRPWFDEGSTRQHGHAIWGTGGHPVSRPIRARARARVMGSYSGGIVPSACAELLLSTHAPPPSEGQSSGRHEACTAIFQVEQPCGTADLAACEPHISATTFGEVPARAPRYARAHALTGEILRADPP
jgi:hypothetical protein